MFERSSLLPRAGRCRLQHVGAALPAIYIEPMFPNLHQHSPYPHTMAAAAFADEHHSASRPPSSRIHPMTALRLGDDLPKCVVCGGVSAYVCSGCSANVTYCCPNHLLQVSIQSHDPCSRITYWTRTSAAIHGNVPMIVGFAATKQPTHPAMSCKACKTYNCRGRTRTTLRCPLARLTGYTTKIATTQFAAYTRVRLIVSVSSGRVRSNILPMRVS